MKLMIDIDQGIAEEIVLYERIPKDYENTVIDSLRNGTPLPEYHRENHIVGIEEWLSTFNTDSATECFTAVQRLKESVNDRLDEGYTR